MAAGDPNRSPRSRARTVPSPRQHLTARPGTVVFDYDRPRDNPNPYPSPNPNPRWFVLHPDMWNKEDQLAWRWHPAELQEGQQQSARSGLAARGEKNRTFAGSVCREGGPPASKDYTIALV